MRFWSLGGALQLFAEMTHIDVLRENEYFHMPQTLPEKLMGPTGAEKLHPSLKIDFFHFFTFFSKEILKGWSMSKSKK